MTKWTLLQQLVQEGQILFPDAETILLWGGAVKRDEIAPYGDIDILLVLPAGTDFLSRSTITRLQQYRASFADRTIEVDPFLTNAAQLAKSSLRFAGPRGEYHPFELIRYQIKYESIVLWGDENVKDRIKPVSLQAALNDIVPKVLTYGIQKVRVEYPAAPDPLAYIAENRNTLLMIARTIYTLRERMLATKEEALSYVQRTYPPLRRLGDLLLQLYIGHRILATDTPSTEEMEDFLTQGEAVIRSFFTANSTGNIT